jgi:uncharacterized membrane protein YoaK (UPF0700 family)
MTQASPPCTRPGSVLWLAGVGGCVDGIGFIALGSLFVSHMSGNSAALGAYFGKGDWQLGLPHLFAIPVFVLGLILGYYFTARWNSMKPVVFILLGEAILLTAFLCLLALNGNPALGSPTFYAMATLPLLAMGLQNATLKKVGSMTFHTTYVTGVLDTLGESSARALLKHESMPPAMASPTWVAKMAASTWAAYIVGALYGSATLLYAGAFALALPVASLVLIARHLALTIDREDAEHAR